MDVASRTDLIAYDGCMIKNLRLLVAIVSFGERNLEFLRQVLRTYEKFDVHVNVTVFSDRLKALGPNVDLRIGLPSSDPWSLPFAHKRFFAEQMQNYDLFAYSEDDVEFTQANLQAFVEVAPTLEEDEIAGFMLYEVGPDGVRSLPNVHGPFHWRPESVRGRGNNTVAEFSNEHSAFYLLTRQQLKTAVQSGGYLRGPCEGKYDMLCTASTDPYTSCGFRKVICISRFRDFLLHHLPNRWHAVHTVTLPAFEEQIATLMAIGRGEHPVRKFGEIESGVSRLRWSKHFYEEVQPALLEMVPVDTGTVLSIGCGSGETESALIQRGARVTAIPLDSVIAVQAQKLGVELIYSSEGSVAESVGDRRFDCVIIPNLLHLLRNPAALLEDVAGCVNQDGTLILSGPNFEYLPVLLSRWFGRTMFKPTTVSAGTRLNPLTAAQIEQIFTRCGFVTSAMKWLAPDTAWATISGSTKRVSWLRNALGSIWRKLGRAAEAHHSRPRSIARFAADRWLIQARLVRTPQSPRPEAVPGPAAYARPDLAGRVSR